MNILKGLRRTIDKNAYYCKKEIEHIKKEPIRIRKLICWDKKTELKAISSKVDISEEQISDLDDRIMGIILSEQQRKRQIKKEIDVLVLCNDC